MHYKCKLQIIELSVGCMSLAAACNLRGSTGTNNIYTIKQAHLRQQQAIILNVFALESTLLMNLSKLEQVHYLNFIVFVIV